MADTKTSVLIVGAGPVGMTLALTLRRANVDVVIVDREKETGRFTRAALVWPRTLELLDFLGIVDGWTKNGVALHNAHVTIGASTATLTVGENASPFPQPRGIGQDASEALLDAQVRQSGADYRRGVEAASVVLEPNGVTAVLREVEGGVSSTVRADWVVGCDGSRSLVREAMGIARVGDRNAGLQLVQGDFRVRTSQTLVPGDVYGWAGVEKFAFLLLLPISPDGHYRVLVAQADDGSRETPTLEQIQERARVFLPDITLSDSLWQSRYRTQHQIAETYRKGRAFVAGDAAHVWVPIGAQGMNIGMQDAFDLGWKLAGVSRGQLPEAVLDTYQTERRPIGERNIADTERLYHALMDVHGWEDALLRRVLPVALGLPLVPERIAARVAGLDFHYEPSLLVAKNEGGSAIRNGMRLPNAWVSQLPQGQTIRLQSLLRAGDWGALGWVLRQSDADAVRQTLRAVAHAAPALSIAPYLIDATEKGISASNPAIPVLRDKPHVAADACHLTHSVVHLVRPDGVVAWQGATPKSVLLPWST